MQVSEAADEAARDRENREFELDYVGESADYRKRVREYTKYLSKAHALLWRRCQTTLRARIESQTGFEDTVRNYTIALLEAIKKHMLDYEESRAWMSVVSDACRRSR